jgi:hypothetical protein
MQRAIWPAAPKTPFLCLDGALLGPTNQQALTLLSSAPVRLSCRRAAFGRDSGRTRPPRSSAERPGSAQSAVPPVSSGLGKGMSRPEVDGDVG